MVFAVSSGSWAGSISSLVHLSADGRDRTIIASNSVGFGNPAVDFHEYGAAAVQPDGKVVVLLGKAQRHQTPQRMDRRHPFACVFLHARQPCASRMIDQRNRFFRYVTQYLNTESYRGQTALNHGRQ